MTPLGKAIRKARQAKGWSAVRLASEAGIARGTLLAAELHDGNLRLSTLRKIEDALGVKFLTIN